MRITLVAFLLIGSVTAFARQEAVSDTSTATNTVDTLKVVEDTEAKNLGFWLAGYMEPSYEQNANGGNLGWGASAVYKEQFHLGLYGVFFAGNYQKRLIFPNEFRLMYYHFGLWMGYKTRFDKPFQFTADVRIGEGKVFWERIDNFYNMFEDQALFVQPSLGVDVKVLRYAALHADLGYRKVTALDLPEVSSESFSGVSFNLMIKLGLF